MVNQGLRHVITGCLATERSKRSGLWSITVSLISFALAIWHRKKTATNTKWLFDHPERCDLVGKWDNCT